MKIKSNYIYLTVILLLVFLIGYIRCCERRETVIVNPVKIDAIRPQITKDKADRKVIADSVPILKAQLLAATNRKNYYKGLYKSTYDSLYDLSDSIGKIRLSIADSIKQKQDSSHEAENQANLELIVNAYNQIAKDREIEEGLEAKIKQDSTFTQYLLTDSIPKVAKSEFKRGKRVGRKQGVIGGVILSGAVIVGVKSVIP